MLMIGRSHSAIWALCAVFGFGCAASADGAGDSAPEVGRVTEALTTITLSGRVLDGTGSGIAGVTVTLAGSSVGTRTTDATGAYSFSGLAAGSYSLRPTKLSCNFSPDVVNLNNQSVNKVQNFTASGSGCSAASHALILVDSRLYALLSNELDQYRRSASARRGFDIELRALSGIDDWSAPTVRNYVIQARAQNPLLEGVLYVGNIKLPSFYKARNDIVLTRLYPNYFQDLDATFTKVQAPGSIDPTCNGTNDPYCVVGDPLTVPPHDFDNFSKGSNPDPEVWAAFLPVGQASSNAYADFANQLRPYFNKLARYYANQIVANGRYYFVSNDIGERFQWAWDAFGGAKIDFYGKPGPNGETGDACLVNGQNLCYARWPTETFSSAAAFQTYYASQPWVAENWQTDTVFMPHMNAALYSVVEVNTHASETWSIVSSAEARTLTKAGLIVSLSGCGVAGFYQPGSTSYVDSSVAVGDNLAVSYLYGSSQAIAAMGDPSWRGHYANYPLIYREMKVNHAYLGNAHLARMRENYARSGSSLGELKGEASEMLFGDPFMDLN